MNKSLSNWFSWEKGLVYFEGGTFLIFMATSGFISIVIFYFRCRFCPVRDDAPITDWTGHDDGAGKYMKYIDETTHILELIITFLSFPYNDIYISKSSATAKLNKSVIAFGGFLTIWNVRNFYEVTSVFRTPNFKDQF